MGSGKKNSGVSSSGEGVKGGRGVTEGQMDESVRAGKIRRTDPLYFFAGKAGDGRLCGHKHEGLSDAWRCGTVVVVDEFGEVWSLYQASKWGLIEIEPIGEKEEP